MTGRNRDAVNSGTSRKRCVMGDVPQIEDRAGPSSGYSGRVSTRASSRVSPPLIRSLVRRGVTARMTQDERAVLIHGDRWRWSDVKEQVADARKVTWQRSRWKGQAAILHTRKQGGLDPTSGSRKNLASADTPFTPQVFFGMKYLAARSLASSSLRP